MVYAPTRYLQISLIIFLHVLPCLADTQVSLICQVHFERSQVLLQRRSILINVGEKASIQSILHQVLGNYLFGH